MADDARDPPDDDDDPTGEALDPANDDDDPPEAPDEPVEGDDPDAPLLDPAVVRRFLSTRTARDIAKNVIRKLIPRKEVDDVTTDALVRAVTAGPPHLEIVLPAWLITIADRTAMRWLTKRARRAKYEGPMPTRVAREDAYTGEGLDDEDRGDAFHDPRAPGDGPTADLLGPRVDGLIGNHVRDREVRDMIRQHADGVPYKEIAARGGYTEAQVANRIYRFGIKYAARLARQDEDEDRRRTLLLWISRGLAATAVAILAVVAWWLLRPHTDDIRPDPARFEPRPGPSASASTPVFLQALPPTPAPAPSETHDKPPKP